MSTTLLAYFPSPPQGVWFLGSVPLRAYAICIIIGIIAALMLGDRRWVARGGEPGVIYDVALWAVPFGLVGGRLYHVLTDWKIYFGPQGHGLLAALRIWDGGLGIWGAVALGGVGAWIACRRRGIPLPAFGDAVAPGVILAQAIGRLGNYFNQELYGRATTVPWGMEIFDRGAGCGAQSQPLDGVSTGQVCAVVHPTFLYELLWNLLIFAALILIDRRYRIGHGRLFALYVAGYCVGRFCIELMRDDVATHFEGIRVNSFTSTFVFIGAVVYFILATKGREDPATLSGGQPAEPLREELQDLAVELRKDVVAAAAGTGLVTAVARGSVDGAGDGDRAGEMQADVLEAEELEPEEPESEPDTVAEDAELGEAEVAAPEVSVESAADLEDAEFDEDVDEVSEDELEGLLEAPAGGAPRSEQAEDAELAEDAEVSEDTEDTEDTDAEDAEAPVEDPEPEGAEQPEVPPLESDADAAEDVAEAEEPALEPAADAVEEAEVADAVQPAEGAEVSEATPAPVEEAEPAPERDADAAEDAAVSAATPAPRRRWLRRRR
ncbi:prolipoprotein diacylglyceryl transferase [Mycolicibacterium fallax]|uniref:Phosphatidylglycerol--prolipoprotein diacylglyceryl transferase n=1 Tax=Mycolicibacterium fallax TaxID=1793 RepID=A0A1X1R7D1_MYCFA|nr:prolipoprotein diacylglyceryl transferase [Mycolicibacterium fallax]ORV00781.1 prolipoprotein diacylglyceryl transferase [Mycolicibacterium fallax]HOW94451.1 prolipoprotein diacylglyceryl transferase [Mycolicibacterium fallax]